MKKNVLGGRKRFVWLLFVFVAFIAFVVILFYAHLKVEISAFSSIEKRAKEVVSAAELQAWATEALDSDLVIGNVTLNNPKYKGVVDLVGVYKEKPYAGLARGNSHSDDHVRITWNAGRLGVCGFDIGRSNFVCSMPKGVSQWADGVYFWVIPD